MIVQNSQPKKIRRSNKIRKIIKDGIVLNFRTTNDLIQKYGDNSKQIKRTNYTKYITKGNNNYFYLKYLELRNIDVLYNFCSIKDKFVLINLKKKLNNDNELIKHFDKNFAIFLLDNEFPFSNKFKEMHNYNYINDNKYSSICLDEINCGKKSKEKSNEIKIFPNLNELDILIDNNKNNDNDNNFYNESANFHLLKKKSQLIQEDLYVEPINSDVLENIKKKRLLNNEIDINLFLFDVETGESTNNKNDNNDNINYFNCYENLQTNNLIFEEKNEENSLNNFQSKINSQFFLFLKNEYDTNNFF